MKPRNKDGVSFSTNTRRHERYALHLMYLSADLARWVRLCMHVDIGVPGLQLSYKISDSLSSERATKIGIVEDTLRQCPVDCCTFRYESEQEGDDSPVLTGRGKMDMGLCHEFDIGYNKLVLQSASVVREFKYRLALPLRCNGRDLVASLTVCTEVSASRGGSACKRETDNYHDRDFKYPSHNSSPLIVHESPV